MSQPSLTLGDVQRRANILVEGNDSRRRTLGIIRNGFKRHEHMVQEVSQLKRKFDEASKDSEDKSQGVIDGLRAEIQVILKAWDDSITKTIDAIEKMSDEDANMNELFEITRHRLSIRNDNTAFKKGVLRNKFNDEDFDYKAPWVFKTERVGNSGYIYETTAIAGGDNDYGLDEKCLNDAMVIGMTIIQNERAEYIRARADRFRTTTDDAQNIRSSVGTALRNLCRNDQKQAYMDARDLNNLMNVVDSGVYPKPDRKQSVTKVTIPFGNKKQAEFVSYVKDMATSEDYGIHYFWHEVTQDFDLNSLQAKAIYDHMKAADAGFPIVHFEQGKVSIGVKNELVVKMYLYFFYAGEGALEWQFMFNGKPYSYDGLPEDSDWDPAKDDEEGGSDDMTG